MTKKMYKFGITETPTGELVDENDAKIRSRNPAQLSFVRNLGLLFVLSSVPKKEIVKAGVSGQYATAAEAASQEKEMEDTAAVTLEAVSPAEGEPAAPQADDSPASVESSASGDLPVEKKGLARFKKAGKVVITQNRVVNAFKMPRLQDAPKPKSWPSRIFFVLAFPLMFLFEWTILDCRKDRFKKFWAVTFIICILYIAFFCHFMVSWSTYVGCFLGIPDAIMGLTLLAVGASMPEVFSCSAVARQGLAVRATPTLIPPPHPHTHTHPFHYSHFLPLSRIWPLPTRWEATCLTT